MSKWVAFVCDGTSGRVSRLECGEAWTSIEAGALCLRQQPWLHASDIIGLVTTEFEEAIGSPRDLTLRANPKK